MTRTLKHRKLPDLEKREASLLMETSCYVINEKPYVADAESLYISPNNILVPNFCMNSLASTTSPLSNINLLIHKLKVYHLEILSNPFLLIGVVSLLDTSKLTRVKRAWNHPREIWSWLKQTDLMIREGMARLKRCWVHKLWSWDSGGSWVGASGGPHHTLGCCIVLCVLTWKTLWWSFQYLLSGMVFWVSDLKTHIGRCSKSCH